MDFPFATQNITLENWRLDDQKLKLKDTGVQKSSDKLQVANASLNNPEIYDFG